MSAPKKMAKWRGWGQNMLLAFGVLYFYGLASMVTHITLGRAVAGRIFSDSIGGFPWHAFTLQVVTIALPSALAALIAGYVAGIYLKFSNAGWVVLLLAAYCGLTVCRAQWFREPATWERGVEIAEPILIASLMPAAFLLKRRTHTVTLEKGRPRA